MTKEIERDPKSTYYHNCTVGARIQDGGVLVKSILSGCANYVIFIDDSDLLKVDFDDTPGKCGADAEGSKNTADQLDVWLNEIALSRKTYVDGRRLIVGNLTDALTHRKEGDTRDFFRDSRAFIDRQSAQYGQAYYLIAAMLAAAGLAALNVLSWYFGPMRLYQEFWWALALGGLGALLSVLRRFKEVVIPAYAQPRLIALDGVTRLLVGGFFGVVLLWFQKAGVIQALSNANSYLTSVFAVIAGFSETFIPGLLERTAMLEKGKDGPVEAGGKAKADSDAKAKADADAKAKAGADAKAKTDADAKAKADAVAKVNADADTKTKADLKVLVV